MSHTCWVPAAASKEPHPGLETLFTDVYAEMPWHLRQQEAELRAYAADHPELLDAKPH